MEENTQQNGQGAGSVSEDIEKLKSERDEYLNGWKRAKADLLNYQKDESKRLENIARFGVGDILKDVIAVIDTYNLALHSIEKSGAEADKGLYIIKGQLEDLLKKRGVTKISVQAGEVFNPMYHEAIAMVDGESSEHSGNVHEVVEEGYMLQERVLKPARVKVVN